MRQNLIILFILLSTIAFGQSHFVGLQTGLNFTSITPKDDLKNAGMKIGFIGGITYNFKFSNRYKIGIEALYSQQGFTDKLIISEGNQVYVGEENYKVNYDYLSFPIKIGYEIGNKLKTIPKIGIVPAFSIGNREVIDYLSKFDFGGLIEIGIENEFSDNIILCSTLSYKHSLTTFHNSKYFDRYEDSKRKHYGFSFSIGLKYRL